MHRRQTDLAIALDRVHDRHNVSAILRTADAVGISEVIWKPDYSEAWEPNPEVAQSAERWVRLQRVDDLIMAVAEYKARGFSVAATHLGASSVDFRSVDWTKPWLLIMGNERKGCSDEILSLADVNIVLPMAGLIQSLNVSVATAIVLYEIQRHREMVGRYEKTLPKDEVEKLYRSWDLAREGIALEQVLEPPSADEKRIVQPHVDGRNNFCQKLLAQKQKKLQNP